MLTRRWLAAQGCVTVVLLVLLLRSLDLAAFRLLFLRLPAQFYFASLAVVLSGQVAYAWRWHVLLSASGVSVPFATVLRQYFIATFVNNFLPSTVGGDAAKVYYVGRDHGYRVVTASVVMDRMLGVGLLASLAAVALLALPVSAPVFTAAHIAVVGVAAAGLVLLIVTRFGTGGLPDRVAWLGSTAVRLAGRLQRLRLDMAASLASAAVIAKAALVVIGYAVVVTLVYMRFVALNGIAPPFLATFAVVTTVAVLSNVPVSLNGLGLREQLHAVLLAPLGVSREAAVAISLLLFGHLLLASLVGLIFWLQAPVVTTGVTDAQ